MFVHEPASFKVRCYGGCSMRLYIEKISWGGVFFIETHDYE